MKTLLVTGANGFTGRHIVSEAINQGFRCISLCRKTKHQIKGLEYIEADLGNFDELCSKLKGIQVDYVIHLAAVSFVAHGSINQLYQTNLIGTLHLIDALILTQNKLEKVIVASSGNVYGEAHQPPINETMLPAPLNDYACSKVAMEQALALRFKKLPIIIARPFNYTGRGQAEHFLVPKIVQAFQAKLDSLALGNLDVARDFSDVRDVCQAYLKLLNTNECGQIYNICSGQPVKLLEIIEVMTRISGHYLRPKVNPKFVRDNEIKVLYGSEDKLQKKVGQLRQYSFYQTLEWMYFSND